MLNWTLLASLWLLLTPEIAPAQTPHHGDATRAVRAEAALPQSFAEGVFTPRRVGAIKVGVALSTTLLLLCGAVRRRTHPERGPFWGADAALLALGLLGGLCWWNLLQFHYPGFNHPRDNFHYYVGSKYFPELGYTRLYACAAVADREAGLRENRGGGGVRNLTTNQLEPALNVLANPESCKRHFSAERWRDFSRDVGWMRNRLSPSKWSAIFADHGYNATPAWGSVGGILANSGPISVRQLRLLTLLDSGLLLVMWGSFAWAFGWRAACVGLVFWGTNYFAPFTWTGGGILRQDWLAASVIGISLLRREHPMAAGFFLTWAALLRIFPALILAALALKVGVDLYRRRTFCPRVAHRRLALGALLCLAIALPLSGLTAGRGDSAGGPARGLGVWLGFYANSRVHLSTPLRNHMGLPTLLTYDPASTARKLRDASLDDPFAPWKDARRSAFAARRPLYALLVLAYVALLARAVGKSEDWVAAVLGIGLIPIATELTSYYFCILLGYAALAERRDSLGILLVLLAALSWGVVEIWHWYDEVFLWTSLAVVAFVVYVTATESTGEVTKRIHLRRVSRGASLRERDPANTRESGEARKGHRHPS